MPSPTSGQIALWTSGQTVVGQSTISPGLVSPGVASQTLTTKLLAGAPTAAWKYTLESISVLDFGAIADGVSHKLSTIYPNLAAAQAVYPWVDDLTPEVDYCAIQAAIDYAYNNSLRCIVLPKGHYLTSAPVFVDPPGSMRAQGTYPRYNPATAYSTPGTIIQYNGIPYISLIAVPAGNAPFFAKSNYPSTGETVGSAYWAFYYSNVAGASATHGAVLGQIQGWCPTFIGEPGQADTGGFGTYILPQFLDIGVIMGPNNGGTARDFTVYFPLVLDPNSSRAYDGQGYEGGLNPYSVGVATAGITAGSSRTIVENIGVQNCYIGFQFGAFGFQLGDSNVMRRCYSFNVYCGAFFSQTQVFINQLYDCNLSATVAVCGVRATISVFGGNYSAFFEQSPAASFGISATSSAVITQPAGTPYKFGLGVFVTNPSQNMLTITTTVASPDSSLLTSAFTDGRAGIYNAFVIRTPHWGDIPFIATAFNAGTGVLSLTAWPPWMDFIAGNTSGFTNLTATAIAAELQAATTMFAANMVFPFQTSVAAYGVFIENICATCLNSYQSFSPSLFSELYNDSEITLASINGGSAAFTANYVIQKSFPFIFCSSGVDVVVDSSFWNASSSDTIVVDCGATGGRLINRDSNQQGTHMAPMINFRWSNLFGPFSESLFTKDNSIAGNFISPVSASIPYWVQPNVAAHALAGGANSAPATGIRPANWTIPPVNASYLATIANSQVLPAIAPNSCNYPLVYGGAIYQTTALHTPGNSLFESSHNYYSHHQDLNQTNISVNTPTQVAALNWSAQGGSPCVYLDATTMQLMFVGLCIGLTTDSLNYYLVTGVNPVQGYITVFQVNNQAYVHGVSGTIYTGTVIKAQPYRVRIMSGPVSTYVSAATTAIAGQEILADTTSAAFMLAMPLNPQQGDEVKWYDAGTSFATNNLIIDGNGAKLNGSFDNLKAVTSGSSGTAIYNATAATWALFTAGTLTAAPALLVSPGNNANFYGHAGGSFANSPFTYTLKSSSSTVAYTITGVPAWLTPSATSGTVTTGGTAVTFTVVGGTAIGNYNATLVFTNTATGQVINRLVALTVGYGLVYAAEGDSITFGYGTPAGYPNLYSTAFGSTLYVLNNAVTGSTLGAVPNLYQPNAQWRVSALDALIATKRTGDKYALSVLLGTNELNVGYDGGTLATFLAKYAAYLDARRSSGWYVVLCTLPSGFHSPPTGGPGLNDTNIALINNEIRLWAAGTGPIVPGVHADAICDFAANAHFSAGGYSNLTYYQADQVHPTTAGQNLMETIIAPVLNAYL